MNEDFDTKAFDRRLCWFNEPRHWRIDPGSSVLVIEPDAGTDFWRKTQYGFEADTGHLLSAAISENFVMTTKLKFFPRHQYDQAGLMVRVDGSAWIKTSVEHEGNDAPKLGAVVTNRGYSDWSFQDFDTARNELLLRISKKDCDYIVEHAPDGQTWQTIRIAHLHVDEATSVHCGIYACSPKGTGFRAEFDLLRIDSL